MSYRYGDSDKEKLSYEYRVTVLIEKVTKAKTDDRSVALPVHTEEELKIKLVAETPGGAINKVMEHLQVPLSSFGEKEKKEE